MFCCICLSVWVLMVCTVPTMMSDLLWSAGRSILGQITRWSADGLWSCAILVVLVRCPGLMDSHQWKCWTAQLLDSFDVGWKEYWTDCFGCGASAVFCVTLLGEVPGLMSCVYIGDGFGSWLPIDGPFVVGNIGEACVASSW